MRTKRWALTWSFAAALSVVALGTPAASASVSARTGHPEKACVADAKEAKRDALRALRASAKPRGRVVAKREIVKAAVEQIASCHTSG